MIKTAGELRATSRNKRVIKSEIKEILKAMEQQMEIVNREGRNNMDFKVPKTYLSVGHDTDSVFLIVTGTLEELLNGGYEVKIRDIQHTFLFSIRWDSDITKCDKDRLLGLLKKHMTHEK